MRVASLVCGAKGVRDHNNIRDGVAAIEIIMNIVYLWSFMTFCTLHLFRRVYCVV